jgi:hypothetical protein
MRNTWITRKEKGWYVDAILIFIAIDIEIWRTRS